MKEYRHLSDQMKICKEKGNLIEVDISAYACWLTTALICLKYKTVCMSRICAKERGVIK
jgi:hypothetical protein